jgi:hypothetical protein
MQFARLRLERLETRDVPSVSPQKPALGAVAAETRELAAETLAIDQTLSQEASTAEHAIFSSQESSTTALDHVFAEMALSSATGQSSAQSREPSTAALDHVFAEETSSSDETEHDAEPLEEPSYAVTDAGHGMLHLSYAHLPEGCKLIIQTTKGFETITLESDGSCNFENIAGEHAWIVSEGEAIELSLTPDGRAKELPIEERREERIEELHHAAEEEELKKKEHERQVEEVARSLEEADARAEEMAKLLEELAHEAAHRAGHGGPHVEHKHAHMEFEEKHEEGESLTDLFLETNREFVHFNGERLNGNGHEEAAKARRQAEHELHEVEHRLPRARASARIEPLHFRYLSERKEFLEHVIHLLEEWERLHPRPAAEQGQNGAVLHEEAPAEPVLGAEAVDAAPASGAEA